MRKRLFKKQEVLGHFVKTIILMSFAQPVNIIYIIAITLSWEVNNGNLFKLMYNRFDFVIHF